jgi:hypothetical protein
VLVVSAQRSDARSVQAGLTKLQSLGPVNILGAVLNGATPDSQALGYYAGTHSAVPLAGTANEA